MIKKFFGLVFSPLFLLILFVTQLAIDIFVFGLIIYEWLTDKDSKRIREMVEKDNKKFRKW